MASAALRPQACRDLGRAPRRFGWGWLALAAALLSGCIPRGRPSEVPQPQAPPEQEQVRPVDTGRLPADETRNRVAVLVPLTGRDAPLGQSILNAANLALLDSGGQRIRITAYDTAAGAAPAASQAIAEGSGLILGPLLAEDVRAVAPIAHHAGVPVVAFSNDVSVAGDGVYIMGFYPGESIARVVAFARGRGINRFGALVPANAYGERSARALNQAVEGEGGRVVGIQTYEAGAAGARSAATRLAGQGAVDAVLIADAPRAVLPALPVLREASPAPHLLATERWASETNLGATPALRGAWFAAPSDSNYNAFRLRYRARYNSLPYRLASLGYDSVLLVVRVAEGWRIGRAFPAQALRDPGGFVGVDGAFRFGRDGVAERALEVREVNATGATVVSPAPRGFN
jgi:ABC-type branched-subunit amino acid transport system substrate-binding protein